MKSAGMGQLMGEDRILLVFAQRFEEDIGHKDPALVGEESGHHGIGHRPLAGLPDLWLDIPQTGFLAQGKKAILHRPGRQWRALQDLFKEPGCQTQNQQYRKANEKELSQRWESQKQVRVEAGPLFQTLNHCKGQ